MALDQGLDLEHKFCEDSGNGSYTKIETVCDWKWGHMDRLMGDGGHIKGERVQREGDMMEGSKETSSEK